MHIRSELDSKFFDGSLSDIWRQGLSLNLDLEDVASLDGLLAQGFPCLLPPE